MMNLMVKNGSNGNGNGNGAMGTVMVVTATVEMVEETAAENRLTK